MKSTVYFFAVLFLAVFADAASTKPVVVTTFLCNGNSFLRIGSCPNGGRPISLIQASDGNFYGAAQVSMEGSSAPTGGNVFSLTPEGKFTVLHTFLPGPGNDYPNGNLPGLLTEGPDGKLYGDTLYGGIGGCNGYCGDGLLYRVNKDGSGFEVVHKFCSEANCADGLDGYGALVLGTDHNLYGTTYYGGTSQQGTLFRLSAAHGYEIVENFSFATIGENPSALIVARDGTFYGTSASVTGELLFHYTVASGDFQTVVLNFPLFNGLPSRGGDLTLGANGNFYGRYSIYGHSGEGLFEVEPDGTNLQLFTFYTNEDGAGEPDGLLLTSDGNFLMADYVGGGQSQGSIIRLSPMDGSLMGTITPFSPNQPVGSNPPVIIQAQDGTIWGTTNFYGVHGQDQFADGTVYNLNLGLPPTR
jgi:uncharacterized repeat protein (TIGR03803 family)